MPSTASLHALAQALLAAVQPFLPADIAGERARNLAQGLPALRHVGDLDAAIRHALERFPARRTLAGLTGAELDAATAACVAVARMHLDLHDE